MSNFWKTLRYAGVEPEDFEACREEIAQDNRKKLHIYLLIAAGFLFLCICLSGGVAVLRGNTAYYTGGFLIILFLAAVALMFPEKNGLLLTWLMYALAGALYAIGILVALSSPEQPSVSFVAFSLAVPLLFTMTPLQHIGNVLFFDVVFILLAVHVESGQAMTLDIIDTVIFGLISCVISTLMMISNHQKFVANHKLREIANYDLLTGVKNRNAFEAEREKMKGQVTLSLGCIYVDANNLHNLNNTQGHESGDQMLQAVALTMQELFGRKHCYRIGGDEFVAVIRNGQADTIQKSADFLRRVMDQKGYSVAVGTALQPVEELDVDELFRTAEKRMYQNKMEYYRSGEHAER